MRHRLALGLITLALLLVGCGLPAQRQVFPYRHHKC